MAVHSRETRGASPASVEFGRITEEGIREITSRVGAWYRSGPYRIDVTEDDIRNNAIANGNWNPLFTDPDYGRRTRYGGQIAAPTYVDLIKHWTAGAIGALPGVHSFHVGDEIEFFRPVRPGDSIGPTFRPWKIEEKQGNFAGRVVSTNVEVVYRNQRDELVAIAHGPCWRVDREQARQRGKYADVKPHRYTDEELQKIWDLYDREEIRGATPRYWEDVEVGAAVGPIVRGPLRVVEIGFRNWSGGGRLTGAGGQTYGAHYFQFEEYARRPGYAEVQDTTGVVDHPHRGHWEDAFARKIGVPGIYDLAVQRTAWICVLMTNWIGDDGWLKRLWCQFRQFNVEGDTTWITGTVKRKWIEDSQHMVEVEVASINQHGLNSTPGGAVVVLPSKNDGGVVPG